MSPRPAYALPEDKQEKLNQALRLEWISLGVLISIIVLMFFTMGASQAMRTSLAENFLGLVPPLSVLISTRFQMKPPTEDFPYGYRRSITIAFVGGSLALFSFGLMLTYEAIDKLIKQEHPTIGVLDIFGHTIWLGWAMIAVLVYSSVLPFFLGRMKMPLARELHAKALYTDADMNRADWMTDSAAILGILGIGMGWWWADSLVAGIIALDICKEGWGNLKESFADLMDRKPITVDSEDEDLLQKVHDTLQDMDWIKEVGVRMREEGDVYCGEAFIVLEDGNMTQNELVEHIEEARKKVHDLHWQMYEIVIMPVVSLQTDEAKPEMPAQTSEQSPPQQGQNGHERPQFNTRQLETSHR